MGKLWVPTYLPEGCEYESAVAKKDFEALLAFERKKPHKLLLVAESPKSARVKVLRNKYETTVVRGQDGYLVHGGWMVSGETGKVSWSETSWLMLFFKVDEWIIRLSGIPAAAWTDDEMIRVAESMRVF